MKNKERKTVKKVSIKLTIILVILICSQYILTGVYVGKEIIGGVSNKKALLSVQAATNDDTDPNKGQYIRLSDTLTENSIPYRSESRAGWGALKVNEDANGNKISVKMEGAYYPFDYGIWAHATSNVYYDISEYSEKYHYLTVYEGINQTSSSGNGVRFWIYTSNSDTFAGAGKSWEIKNDPERVVMPGQDAVFEKIDIRGAKYLRLQVYDNGGNGNDHSVWVNPMLITDDYKEDDGEAYNIELYDQKIKNYANKNLSDPNYELLVLQRKFISSVGNYALKRFIDEDPSNQETINWLMNDVENLRYYILGGAPLGGYYNSLKELTRLLKAYKNDFNDQTQISEAGKTLMLKKNLNWPTTKGNLYKRMAITLSLTHSAGVNLWMQNSEYNKSDSVNRYKIYKDLYNNGQFKATDTVDMTSWFETFKIEEMRWVLGTYIDDEEVIWLNEYTQTRIDAQPGSVWGLLTPHPYMAYVWPNYANPVYYDEANKEYFNDLFKVVKKNEDGTTTEKGLFEYVPYRNDTSKGYVYKLWMNFRNKFGTGAVCGGISKTGHCIRGVNSIPSAVIGQPGHAALLYFNQNAEGKAVWGIDNDVSGWAYSEKGERMPLGWGNDRTYVKGYNIPYVIMAQEALNDYNNLVKAEELLMTADVYNGDFAKQEAIYRDAIKIQSINLDAWADLVKLYMSDETKTEEQYYNLAKEMMEATKCFPFVMYNLSNYISTKFTSIEYQFKFTLLQTRILEEAKNYPDKDSAIMQPGTTRGLAAHLLGQIDTELAKFSFDGDDKGKIVLSSRFDGNGVRWDYSLDGKKTWNEVAFDGSEEHKLQLTEKQIASITSENDIYVHIVGVNYSEENLYKIDILESEGLPSTLYASDLENRMIAVNLSTEWRYVDTDKWTKYSDGSPDLTGDKTVQLRQGATGVHLASKDPQTFTFTKNTDPDTRKYIPVSHLSKVAVSTEATSHGGAAVNALDANLNTRFHSAWNGTDTQRFLTVKLDNPVYLSAVEFVPAGGGNGRIVDGTIYGSMDGENWFELTKRTGITYPRQANTNEEAIAQTQKFEIENPKEVQYVKIVADKTNGNWFTARAFNFYQDLTKNPHPTAGIGYSTTEKTNEPVVARLINPSTKITITSEGGDSHVFTENGEFTFEFVDENGNKGTAKAKVDWIDKSGPTADVQYKLSDDKKLIAVLDNVSEDVYLLDKNNKKTNYIEVENGKVVSISYLDDKENTYKVTEVDENRVATKITYVNTTGKVPSVAYYVNIPKNGDEEHFDEQYIDKEGNIITNLTEEEKASLRVLQQTTRSNPLEYYLEKNEEYEFKMLDKASNITNKNIKVDYIENDTKILASDITYSTTTLTKDPVKATITPYIIDMNGEKQNAKVINNEGSTTYVFNRKGEFTFEYADSSKADDDPTREVETHTARVDWIDVDKPTAEIKYTTVEGSNNVIATLVNESESITIINNGGKREYTFTKDGEFIFEFQDKAGNIGRAIAVVNNGTGRIKGDINNNGEVDIDDLAKVKLHFLETEYLTGLELKIADMDQDGEITVEDIAQIKLIILNSEN